VLFPLQIRTEGTKQQNIWIPAISEDTEKTSEAFVTSEVFSVSSAAKVAANALINLFY
jgi:hypothetical protein